MDDVPHLGIEYALIWWLMLEGAGLLVLPLAFRLFRHLPDRGYAFAKPLSLIPSRPCLSTASMPSSRSSPVKSGR